MYRGIIVLMYFFSRKVTYYNFLYGGFGALDEDLGLKEAERSVERLFTKSFDNPIDQKRFERIRFIFLQL